MDRNEVKELLMTLDVTYTNFKLDPATLSFTINSWFMLLEEYDYNDVKVALKTFVNTSKSAFAPSPSELIGLINKPQELALESGAEAFSLVRKAIANSTYNYEAEYNKLPPLVQKAVGSADLLHYWATNEYFAEGTVMKSFLDNYRQIIKRENDTHMLPAEAKLRLEQIRQKALTQIDSNAFLIGQKADKLQEGDFNYEGQQRPDNETLGHYAEQLRERLGVE